MFHPTLVYSGMRGRSLKMGRGDDELTGSDAYSFPTRFSSCSTVVGGAIAAVWLSWGGRRSAGTF